MEIIKRNVQLQEKENLKISRMGINNIGTLSLIVKDLDEEIVINLCDEEFKKLKEFILRFE